MRSHRSTGVFPAYIKKIRYNFLLAEETRNRTPLNGMLRSDDKVTNSFRKITKEVYKCFWKIRDQKRFCTVSSAYLTDNKSKQVIAPHFFFISKLLLSLFQ